MTLEEEVVAGGAAVVAGVMRAETAVANETLGTEEMIRHHSVTTVAGSVTEIGGIVNETASGVDEHHPDLEDRPLAETSETATCR